MNKNQELLWRLFVELRKEVLLAQETRAKIIGFKITFLSAGIGLIYANIDKVNSNLLIIPAIAAVFFDLLINSYSISTKRIGHYCRKYLEPGFLVPGRAPNEFMLWESFVNQKEVKQHFSLLGNLGITFIIIATASINGFFSLELWQASGLTALFLVLFTIDAYAHVHPTRKIGNLKDPEIDFTLLFKKDDP